MSNEDFSYYISLILIFGIMISYAIYAYLHNLIREQKRRDNNFYQDKIYYLDFSNRQVPIPREFGYQHNKIEPAYYLVSNQATRRLNSNKDYNKEVEIFVWEDRPKWNLETSSHIIRSVNEVLEENIRNFSKYFNFRYKFKEDNEHLKKYMDWDICQQKISGIEKIKNNGQEEDKDFYYTFITARRRESKGLDQLSDGDLPYINVCFRHPDPNVFCPIEDRWLEEIIDKLTKLTYSRHGEKN